MGEAAPGAMRIEVVFADVGRVYRFEVDVVPGATVAQALAACPGLPAIGALRALLDAAGRGAKEAPHGAPAAGIYGRRARLDEVLAPGDRIELCRPLLADPKQARRRRAAAAP